MHWLVLAFAKAKATTALAIAALAIAASSNATANADIGRPSASLIASGVGRIRAIATEAMWHFQQTLPFEGPGCAGALATATPSAFACRPRLGLLHWRRSRRALPWAASAPATSFAALLALWLVELQLARLHSIKPASALDSARPRCMPLIIAPRT